MVLENIKNGVRFFEGGQFNEAEEIFLQALYLQPENYEILNNLGVIHYTKGHIQKAENHFLKSLIVKGDYPDALLNLAQIYQSVFWWEQSAIQLEKYILLDDKNVDILNQLGMVYLEMGSTQNERVVLAKYLEINPMQQLVKDTLKKIERRQINQQKGSQDFSFSLAKNEALAGQGLALMKTDLSS